jgi:hypothetical protein
VTGLLVVVPVEGEPMIIVDALNESEERRLHDWLASSYVLTRVAANLLAFQGQLLFGEDEEPEAA